MSILLIILTTVIAIAAGVSIGIIFAVSKISKMYQELEDLTDIEDEE